MNPIATLQRTELETTMTDEDKVRAKWPDVMVFGPPIYIKPGSVRRFPDYGIFTVKGSRDLGYGDTESDAWADAARKLEESR
jgi:hypothetical protein